jgi:putative sterol carrier protein
VEEQEVTIRIRNQSLEVEDGHVGTRDLRVVADRDTWLGFVAGERSLVWALLRGKIRLKGSPRHLLAFGRCFPS